MGTVDGWVHMMIARDVNSDSAMVFSLLGGWSIPYIKTIFYKYLWILLVGKLELYFQKISRWALHPQTKKRCQEVNFSTICNGRNAALVSYLYELVQDFFQQFQDRTLL